MNRTRYPGVPTTVVEPSVPLTAGLGRAVGAVASRALSNKSTKVRIAGRAERRDAYVRFLEAVLNLERFPSGQQGLWRRFRLWADEAPMRSLEAEIDYALYQLLLVGNALPLLAGLKYVELSLEVANRELTKKRVAEKNREQRNDAREAYWAACRLDVNHGPRRWQIYRPVWWKNRRLKALYLQDLEAKVILGLSKELDGSASGQ